MTLCSTKTYICLLITKQVTLFLMIHLTEFTITFKIIYDLPSIKQTLESFTYIHKFDAKTQVLLRLTDFP